MLIGLQIVSGLVSASILFLLASGLSLIFGVCRVLNIAHGAFFMLAAYLAFAGTNLLEGTGVSFWLTLVLAPLVLAGLGALVEVLVFRKLYGKDILIQLLPTIALAFIVADVIRFVWGLESKTVPFPGGLPPAVEIFGVIFPSYYAVIVVGGVAIAVGLWVAVFRTRWGTLVRAIAQDRDMSASLGINETAIYTGVFALAAWLAGVAGVLSSPLSGAALGSDLDAVIDAFVVVVVGGLTSIPGALLAAILIGMVRSFGILVIPQFAMAFVFGLMALVLIVRPHGLLGRKEG
ncbi:MAG: branched-chain amino acid ABC transporter permease [Rhodospirillales bacterium]